MENTLTEEQVQKLSEDAQASYYHAILQDALKGAGIGAISLGIPCGLYGTASVMDPSNAYGFDLPGALLYGPGIHGGIGGILGGTLGGVAGGITGAIRNALKRRNALKQLSEEKDQKKEAAFPFFSKKELTKEQIKKLQEAATRSRLEALGEGAGFGALAGAASLGPLAGAYSAWKINDTYKDCPPWSTKALPGIAYGAATGATVGGGLGLTAGGLLGLLHNELKRRKAERILLENNIPLQEKQSDWKPYAIGGGIGSAYGLLLGALFNKIAGKKTFSPKGLLYGMLAGGASGAALGHYENSLNNYEKHNKELRAKYIETDENGNKRVKPGIYWTTNSLVHSGNSLFRSPFMWNRFKHSDNTIISDTPFDSGLEQKPINGQYIFEHGLGNPEELSTTDLAIIDMAESEHTEPYLNNEHRSTDLKPGKTDFTNHEFFELASGNADKPSNKRVIDMILKKIAPYRKSQGHRIPGVFSILPNRNTNSVNCHATMASILGGLPGLSFKELPTSFSLGAPTTSQIERGFDMPIYNDPNADIAKLHHAPSNWLDTFTQRVVYPLFFK